MPEYSYIALACKKLKVDPASILAFHEYVDTLALITSEGKKHVFTFEELEDFHKSSQKTQGKPLTSKSERGPVPEGYPTPVPSAERAPMPAAKSPKRTPAAKSPKSPK
jgi:hypothetical protein